MQELELSSSSPVEYWIVRCVDVVPIEAIWVRACSDFQCLSLLCFVMLKIFDYAQFKIIP